MIRWIVGTSLRFRFIVVALGLGLTYFGAQRLKEIPIDVFPEFAPARVEVQTLCLGLSPAEVEEQVTVPIENAMNGVPGVEILRSSSVPQLSSVTRDLRAWRRRIGGAAARDRARRHRDARHADLGGAAGHDAARVVDEPGHEDRRHVEGQVHDGPVHARLLEYQGAAARAFPASPMSRSGASS